MALPKVDAVVIGAGAGGGVTFCQLAEAGLSVVCLERGRWHSPFEERKDDLVNQRNSSLGVAYGPDEDKNPRVFVDLDGRERVVHPRDGAYQPNAACVGGGTFSYGAQAWRYMPQDFRMRTTYGAIEGSTLEDWPISYDDMEPFYEMAEYEIGVSGDVEPNVFKGPRKKPLPMPPDVAAVRASGTCSTRRRSGSACTRSTRRSPSTACPTTAARPACASAGASASAARRTPRTARTTP